MCLSSPDVPKTPPAPQEVKAPDASVRKNRNPKNGMGGGSLLTGPSGIATASLNTGGASLLGG